MANRRMAHTRKVSARRLFVGLLVMLATGGASSALAGPGDLLISPTRIVLEGRDRVADLTLVNKGMETTTFRVSFENRRMLSDGRFEKVETPKDGEQFSAPFVRFAPRQVTLAPGAPQTLRLIVRKPADLEPGEYRSHLLLSAIPDVVETAPNAPATGGAISIALQPIFGLSIPVIVREGILTASVEIGDIDLDTNAETALAKVQVRRLGTRSLYGDLRLIDDRSGSVVAERRGLAVYTPNSARWAPLPLPSVEEDDLSHYSVLFEDRSSTTGAVLSDPVPLLPTR